MNFSRTFDIDRRGCLKPSFTKFGFKSFKRGFILIMIINCACKKYDLEHWPVTYPPELEFQMNLFLDNAPQGLQTKPLTIKLTDNLYLKNMKVSGLCSYHKKTIYLDTTSAAWNHSRTSLVMHELGHYVLHREHLNDTTTILDTWHGFPVSFMNYTTDKPSDWNLKREDLLEFYMKELFNPQPTDVSIVASG